MFVVRWQQHQPSTSDMDTNWEEDTRARNVLLRRWRMKRTNWMASEREDEGKWIRWGQTGEERGSHVPVCITSCSQGHIRLLGVRRCHGTKSDIKLCLFVILESIYSSAMCEPNKLNFINIRLFDTHALKSLGFLSFLGFCPFIHQHGAWDKKDLLEMASLSI